MTDLKKIVTDTKQWIEQERVWDDSLLASAPPIPRSPAPSSEKASALKALYEKYKDCTRCSLGHSRIKFVFGVGNPNAEALFIGEGPGYDEDRKGEPFVGKSGQLLDKMMAAIGLSRQTNAYIANIVKCHPMTNPKMPEARGNDRPPTPEEVETCSPILLQQILIMQPKVIMTLGSPSTKMILKTKDAITGLRGKLYPFPVDQHYPPRPLATGERGACPAPQGAGAFLPTDPLLQITAEVREALGHIQILPTFHPAALLRNPNLKPDAWNDLKLLRDTLAKT